MITDLRRILWNTKEEPLNENEEYTLWSSHIKMMFSLPTNFYSEYDVTHPAAFSQKEPAIYETGTFNDGKQDSIVTSLEPSGNSFTTNDISEGSISAHDGAIWPFCLDADPFTAHSSYWDVAVQCASHNSNQLKSEYYPWCFYPRMMRNVSINENPTYRGDRNTLEKNAQHWCEKGRNIQDSASSVRSNNKDSLNSHVLSYSPRDYYLDGEPEAQSAQRLATLLRNWHKKRSSNDSHQSEDYYTTDKNLKDERAMPPHASKESFIPSLLNLGDAKVEESQSKFMEEATSLLLYIKRRNNLSCELCLQSAKTKLILAHM